MTINASIFLRKTVIKAPVTVGQIGRSAYRDAVLKGYTGTLDEWLASLRADSWETVGEPLDLAGRNVAVIGPFAPGYQYWLEAKDLTADTGPAQLTFGVDNNFEYPPQINPSTTLAYVKGAGAEGAELCPDPDLLNAAAWELSGFIAYAPGHLYTESDIGGSVSLPALICEVGKTYVARLTAAITGGVGVYGEQYHASGVLETIFLGAGQPFVFDFYQADITQVSVREIDVDRITDTAGRFVWSRGALAITAGSTTPANDLGEVPIIGSIPGCIYLPCNTLTATEAFNQNTVLTVNGEPVAAMAGHHFSGRADNGDHGVPSHTVPYGLDGQYPSDFDLLVSNFGSDDSPLRFTLDWQGYTYRQLISGAYTLPANYLLFSFAEDFSGTFLSGTITVKRQAI